MQHYILRCKHCGKEYVYCTYGNGPEYGTEAGCSQTYCAECQTSINNALSKIDVKFRPEFRTIDGVDEETAEKLNKVREDWKEKSKDFVFPVLVKYIASKYDNVEEITADFTTYRIHWNNDNCGKLIKRLDEFDIKNNRFTNKIWRADKPNGYTECKPSKPVFHADCNVPVEPMSEAVGLLSYMYERENLYENDKQSKSDDQYTFDDENERVFYFDHREPTYGEWVQAGRALGYNEENLTHYDYCLNRGDYDYTR